jgi:hypothetical protein
MVEIDAPAVDLAVDGEIEQLMGAGADGGGGEEGTQGCLPLPFRREGRGGRLGAVG